jgi:hypothetical protein
MRPLPCKHLAADVAVSADIDLRRDDASKSLKLAQLADEATTLQAAHAQSMKERMDNQESEFVGLKKQVDSQTDLLH